MTPTVKVPMRVLKQYCLQTKSPQSRSSNRQILLASLVFLLAASTAHAAVAVLLEQPYGKLNLIDPAGHSAVYLDHVCAETPLKLRQCRPGELGVVLSRYDGIGNHDWVAMPLLPYLYAVNAPSEIPQTIDRAGESQLRETYRQRYLQLIAPNRPDGSVPSGNWYELMGSAYDRTIYGFRVNTTAEQDARLIATFNDHKNVADYNGAFRNCADFARTMINRFYPHAVRRNYIADLGLTSPKSVARSLSHYAAKHPEIGFEVFIIPQVKGDLPRSHANTDLAEGILKRCGVPLTVMSPALTAVVFAAYLGNGRFAMPKDAPLLNLSDNAANDLATPILRPFPETTPVLPQPANPHIAAPAATPALTFASRGGAKVSLVHLDME